MLMLRLGDSLSPPVASLLNTHLVRRRLTFINAYRVRPKVVSRSAGGVSAWTISLPPGARCAERVASYQRAPEIELRDSRRPSSLVWTVGFSTATDRTRQPDLVLRGSPATYAFPYPHPDLAFVSCPLCLLFPAQILAVLACQQPPCLAGCSIR